jgi:hypothetical protein
VAERELGAALTDPGHSVGDKRGCWEDVYQKVPLLRHPPMALGIAFPLVIDLGWYLHACSRGHTASWTSSDPAR